MTCWVTQVSAMWTSLIGFVTDVVIQLVDFTFTAMYLSGHVFTLVLYIKLNIVLKCWHERPLCSWLGYSFMCKYTTNLRLGCFYPILGTLNKSSCGRMSQTHSLHLPPPFISVLQINYKVGDTLTQYKNLGCCCHFIMHVSRLLDSRIKEMKSFNKLHVLYSFTFSFVNNPSE